MDSSVKANVALKSSKASATRCMCYKTELELDLYGRKIRVGGSMIAFFADEQDLLRLFKLFDKVDQLIYTKSLSKVGEQNEQFFSAANLTDYLVSFDKPVQSNVFLVTSPSTVLHKREIVMSDGSGIKLTVDQINNYDSIEILLGGEANSSTIVTTTIRTTGETKIAKDLFREFKKIVVKNSAKIGTYYVMSNALNKLEQGWRLAQGIGFPEKYNLARSTVP